MGRGGRSSQSASAVGAIMLSNLCFLEYESRCAKRWTLAGDRLVVNKDTEMALMCSADEELKGKFVYAFLPFTKKLSHARNFKLFPGCKLVISHTFEKKGGPDLGRNAAT